jgi:hypothetical protein
MKNVSICIMLLCSITLFAQRPGHGKMDNQKPLMEKMKSFTPEQQAALESKRLTLSLDLNENQQQAVKNLSLENTAKRKSHRLDPKAREKLTSEELYQLQVTKLDNKIAFKSGMRSILNKDQFAKWEQINMAHRKHHGKSRWAGRLGEHRKKR